VEGFHQERRYKTRAADDVGDGDGFHYTNKPFAEQRTLFVWLEIDGHRGSVEIGTTLFLFVQSLMSKHPNLKKLLTYSDACGGQNKSQFIIGK